MYSDRNLSATPPKIDKFQLKPLAARPGKQVYASYSSSLNSLILQLNPSAQRCLLRLFTGDFNF
jgi:hypothetical protein